MKLGMTGTRNGMTHKARETLISFLDVNDITEVHHGDCVGSDRHFHDVCTVRGIPIIIHPPLDSSLRAFCRSDHILKEKDYLQRNRDIVNQTDCLIAFIASNDLSGHKEPRSGTWYTIRYARRLGRPVVIITPDGFIH